MALSPLHWQRHLYLIYLLVSVVVSTSFPEEPTEEPQENTDTDSSNLSVSTSNKVSKEALINPENENLKQSEPDDSSKSHPSHNENHAARSFLNRAGPGGLWNWRTAGRMLTQGLRMFRESLLEGTKVAHMFKEDIDEGFSSIMRQNRGVKADGQFGGQHQADSSGSFFDSQLLRDGVLGGILRFMGINSKQMGVIALNVLIIFAEWITSSMIGGNEMTGATSRTIKSSLLEWANTGHNPQIESILSQAKSHSLPETLIETLSEKTGNSTSCVQLLLCKMTPIIWGFQDTVKDELNNFGFHGEQKWKTASTTTTTTTTTNPPQVNDTTDDNMRFFLEPKFQNLLDSFLGRLPPTERMVDFGDRCEIKFPQCQLLKF